MIGNKQTYYIRYLINDKWIFSLIKSKVIPLSNKVNYFNYLKKQLFLKNVVITNPYTVIQKYVLIFIIKTVN